MVTQLLINLCLISTLPGDPVEKKVLGIAESFSEDKFLLYSQYFLKGMTLLIFYK